MFNIDSFLMHVKCIWFLWRISFKKILKLFLVMTPHNWLWTNILGESYCNNHGATSKINENNTWHDGIYSQYIWSILYECSRYDSPILLKWYNHILLNRCPTWQVLMFNPKDLIQNYAIDQRTLMCRISIF